jgi:tetratricopeptide (TPR) repeat protein
LGKYDEASHWIGVAESEEIFPAKTAFLKGTLLFKEGKNQEAIASFEKAKELDEDFTQSADYQIALCYVGERKLAEARTRFQAAIQRNPGSDLAAYAREYQDLVEDRIFLERPLRFKVGLLPFYDSNVVLTPGDLTLVPPAFDKPTAGFNTTFNIDWVPVMEGPWLFNGQYALSSRIHQDFGDSHDYLSNTINLYPGYDFGRYVLNMAVRYNLTWVRDPSYKRYVSTLNVGPLFRTTLNSKHVFEAFAGYNDDYYFRETFDPAEDRSGNGLDAFVSWIWLFKPNAFLNARLEYLQQNTDGANWENDGYRGSVNMVYPLTEKLRLQVAGEAYIQDYKNNHTFSVYPFLNQKRDDKTYTGILGLTWALDRHFSFIAQYTYVRADSNIAFYDYNRTIIVGGVEIRF